MQTDKGIQGLLREIRDVLIDEIDQEELDEIIRKVGNRWVLYTKRKDPKTGKHRRLGTHTSKKGAIDQELAIKYSQGQ